MKDAQQDVIEELRRELENSQEIAKNYEDRYFAARELVNVGVQKVEELERELEELHRHHDSTMRHMDLCRSISDCPGDETLSVWLEREFNSCVRLDDPVVKGLVDWMTYTAEHHPRCEFHNAGTCSCELSSTLTTYNARLKEVGK